MNLASNIAVSRLVAAQRAMDITADNLANVDTPGYKSEHVLFTDWLTRQGSALGGASSAGASEPSIAYVQDRATWRDQTAGTLTHTGNPFDLALSGSGYFTVKTPAGPRLTRNGRFGPMPDGTLADMAGNPLLDTTGQPIKLAPTDTVVTIAGDGTLSGENGQLGKIGVVAPSDPMRVTAEGGTLFRADVPTTQVTTPGMLQGAVESSNVQPVIEVTRMMDGLRQFQFVTEMVQAENDRQQSAIDKLLPQGS